MMFETRYMPMITQVMIGGVVEKPMIWILDPLGSIIPDDYAAVGSGAEIAIGVIENGYTENLTEAQAKELSVKAIRSAIKRDVSSGDGIDLLYVTKDGLREETISLAQPN